MSQIKIWITGARVRTLPLAIAPVLLGSATASTVDRFDLVLTILALVVALALQIGVNYANDYSDGIRGTDDNRVGPKRITASKSARPVAVRNAAFIFFGIAALAGLAIIIISGQYFLVFIGLLAILAAWYYTGGKSPYGYAGLGEVVVFVFFGLVATIGTNFVQTGFIDPLAVMLGVASGLYATAVLLVNNIRDIETDEKSGKVTLAVRLGEKVSKRIFVAMIWFPVLVNLLLISFYPATVFALFNQALVIPATFILLTAKTPKELITVLKLTSFAGFGYGLLIAFGIFFVSLSF
jgi:1,4-dihydroxy-2-naphthoate octaprenyltransferase